MSREEMENIYLKQMLYLKGISKRKKVKKTKSHEPKTLTEADVQYLPTQTVSLDPASDAYKKNKIRYGNFTNVINAKYQLE